MADRIIGMRKALKENLEKLGSPLSWEHITNQVLIYSLYRKKFWACDFTIYIPKLVALFCFEKRNTNWALLEGWQPSRAYNEHGGRRMAEPSMIIRNFNIL
jgi:hypothetical protein